MRPSVIEQIVIVAAAGLMACTAQNGKDATVGPLASGAVSDANVSATAAISPSKIAGGAWTGANDGAGSGLDADLLDGLHAADLQRRFQRTVVVSPVVGDPLASGSVLLDAVAGITGATDSYHVLVLLEPGHYDLGAATLALPMNVGLSGLDQGDTMISSTGPGATISAVNPDPVNVWMWVMLRSLNVIKRGGGANAMAIDLADVAAEIRNVTVNSFDGTATTYGIRARNDSLHTISDIRVYVGSASGIVAGIYCDGCAGMSRLSKAFIGVSDGTDVAGLRVANGGSIRFTDLDISEFAATPTVAAGVNVISGTAQLLGSRLFSRSGFGVVLGNGATAEVRTSEIIGSTGGVSLGSRASATIMGSTIQGDIVEGSAATVVVKSSTLTGGITGPADASAKLAFTDISAPISGPVATCFAVSNGWTNSKGLNLCP